VRKFKRK